MYVTHCRSETQC